MSNGTLLSGPSFSALREEAFSRARSLAGDGPEQVLFFEENTYQQEAIADAWAESYNPLCLTVTDIASFVSRVHERLYGPYPGVGTFERRRIIEQALEAVDEAGLIADARQHSDAFSELFRELEGESLLTPDAVRTQLESTALSESYVEPVATAFEEYVEFRSELVHPEAVPQNQKTAEVATADQPLASVRPTVNVVVISGLLEPTAVEQQLLQRLTDEFHVLYVLPETTRGDRPAGADRPAQQTRQTLEAAGFESEYIDEDGDTPLRAAATTMFTAETAGSSVDSLLTWHQAPTPDREVRHIARRLREDLAEKGYAPDDILLVAPGLLSYREQLADSFSSYGIEYAMNLGVFLEHSYAGRAVLDAVELCEQPSADGLAGLASNPVVEIPDVDVAELTDVARRLYTADIDRYRSELDQSRSGTDAFLDMVADVREASAASIVPEFQSLLDYIGVGDPEQFSVDGGGTTGVYERRAVRRVQKSLASVEQVCTVYAPVDPLNEVASALEGVRVPAPQQDPTNRVEVIGLQDTPMADFERLYVLGATANHLPGSDNRARFFRRVGDALGVLPEDQTRNRARYRFATLLANAERVHISTPERTMDDDQLLVSPLVTELARVSDLTPTQGIDTEQRGSREDLQRAMGRHGADAATLSSAMEQAGTTETFEPGQVATAQRGIECAANRSRRDLTPHDGQLQSTQLDALDDDLTRSPYSYHRLSAYATCGFKYLLENGLDFDEPESIEPGLDNRVVGDLVHDILEAFFTGLQTERADPIALSEYDRAELERRLVEATETVVANGDHSIESVFDERLLSILLAGLATPADNDYYRAIGPQHNSGAGLLVRFLETELEADTDRQPALFEAEFGDDGPITLPDGTELTVGGRIDRIDIDSADGTATVFDYKTSRRGRIYARERHAVGGLDFQLPLYALAANSLATEVDDVVDAAYYQVRAKPAVNRFGSLARRFDDGEYAPFLYEATPRRIRALTGALEQGAFHPAVVGADAAQCEYCSFRDTCDVRHHRRHETIDAAADRDQVYIPDIAWSDDWEDMHHRLAAAQGGDSDD